MGLEDVKRERHEPPMDWFTAFGYQDRGILVVGVSERFTSLANGEVKRHYDEWCHYTGNPVTPDDPPERVQRATKAISEAEAFILRVTGFSPREIMDTAYKLQDQYRWKKQSPIETTLF